MDTDPRSPSDQQCAAAEAWLAKGAPRAALTAAGAALAEASGSLRAHRLRARALLDLGQPETAVLDLVAVAEASPESPAPWYDVLAVAQQVGDRPLIERAVARLDAANTVTSDALLDAVDAAYLDGDLDAAMSHLDHAVEIEPAHAELAQWTERLGRKRPPGALDLELAAALIRRGRPHDALARLDRIADGSRDGTAERQAAAAFFRGRALLRLGRFDEAIEALEFARSVAADDIEIALELATAAHLAGDHPTAIRVCDEMLARDPAQVSAVLLAAEAHLAVDDLDIARRLAQRALDVAAYDAAAWYTWAGVLTAAGDATGARVAADHAIALDPGVAAAWQRGADVLQILGRGGLAEWYRAAVVKRGGRGRVVDRHELPALSADEADVDDALRRSSDPATPFVLRDRFRVACELQSDVLAVALGEQLAGTDADDGSVSSVLGFIAVERADLDAARARFRSALDANPGDEEASAGLALVAGLARATTTTPEVATAAPAPAATWSSPSQLPPPQAAAGPTPAAPMPRPRRRARGDRARKKIGLVAIARRVVVLVWMAVGFTTSGLMFYRLLQGDQNQQSRPVAAQVSVPAAATAPSFVPTPPSTAFLPLETVAPTPSPPPTVPDIVMPTVPATAPPTLAPTVPPTAPPTTFDEFVPLYFATPEEALDNWLSFVDPPYAGTCDSLSGQTDLVGVVTCSVYDHDADVGLAQVFRWGVFGTDDLRGWVLVDAGSDGWSVADETFESVPPW